MNERVEMRRPEFNEKTEVKVISRKYYGVRGTVVKFRVDIEGGTSSDPVKDKEAVRAAYEIGLDLKKINKKCVRHGKYENLNQIIFHQIKV